MGTASVAEVAGPPSPENPGEPAVPAIEVIVPEGVTLRTTESAESDTYRLPEHAIDEVGGRVDHASRRARRARR